MVIAVATAKWYFSKSRARQGAGQREDEEEADPNDSSPVMTGLNAAFVSHFGSVVVGSLILSIVQFVRDLLMYIKRKTKKRDGKDPNAVLKVLLQCCGCCLCCLEYCLKFIMQEAFILMAIFGKSFCVSCRQSWGLITRNTVRLGSLHLVRHNGCALLVWDLATACHSNSVSS
jgi:hypothetical protein